MDGETIHLDLEGEVAGKGTFPLRHATGKACWVLLWMIGLGDSGCLFPATSKLTSMASMTKSSAGTFQAAEMRGA